MPTQARKYVLPKVVITELSEANNELAREVKIPERQSNPAHSYFVASKIRPSKIYHQTSSEYLSNFEFDTYPLILDRDGVPWPEANIWILTSLMGKNNPNISSAVSLASDLTAFLRFLEDKKINWLDFNCEKLLRPTYRFSAFLTLLIQSEEIAQSTAKRMMRTVIRFYSWLKDIGKFEPARAPWKESDVYVETTSYYGAKVFKAVTTTDISIKVTEQNDPYSDYIQDGGKLRPLTQTEQESLIDALRSSGNTEMTLIHLLALFTGARLQTILTFRFKHVMNEVDYNPEGFIRLTVGAGTGIDTKFDKRQVLHIPIWLYELLRTYSMSDRARMRRGKAPGGDIDLQYLFLSNKGCAFYAAKTQQPGISNTLLRHSKSGQAVWQFINEEITPYVRQNLNAKFQYRFHDLRATFGMNLVDDRMKLVEEKKLTLSEVFDFVRVRMGHSSLKTTEGYFTYRSRILIVRHVQDAWEDALTGMALKAMGGANDKKGNSPNN